MTVLTFPSNPIEGQVYNAPNGIRYVYDGVKWVVETTTSTSEAVTNSTQDRVAPMFVNGDHEGISFTYNSATNALTATVTAVNGDSLVSGNYTLELGSNGRLNLPESDIQNVAVIQSTESIQIIANGKTWSFANDGNLTIPENGDILDSNGSSVLDDGGGSGTSLINGSNQVVLEADGSLTFPTKTFKNWNDVNETGPTLQLGNDPASQVLITGPAPNNTYWDAQRIVIQGQQGYGGENNDKGEGGDVYIWAGSGGDGGSLQPRGDGGDVKLRGGLGGNNGGYIRIESGDAQAASGTGGFLDLNAGNAGTTGGTGGNVNINAGGGNSVGGNVNIDAGQGDNLFGGSVNISAGYGPTEIGSVNIETGTGNWSFKPDGSFSISGSEVHIATNNWGIGVGGGTGATGVVYTAKQYNLSSIRVHATIEGNEDGDATGLHTQACDMMIIRRVTDAGAVTVDSVVYGVIYSGTGPLATLDAQWNPGTGDPSTGRIEITATPISTTNNVYVKIYATEVSRGD